MSDDIASYDMAPYDMASDDMASDDSVSDGSVSDVIGSDGISRRPKDPGIKIEDISSLGLATNSWQVLIIA